MSRRLSRIVVAVGLLTALAPMPGSAPVRAEGSLEKVGEFRPFGLHNKLGSTNFLSAVDGGRDTWFFVTTTDPATGAVGPPNVFTFELQGPRQRGGSLKLTGSVPSHLVGAVDEGSGIFWFVYTASGAIQVAAISSTPEGPKLLRQWAVGTRLGSESGAFTLTAAGITFGGGKGYLAAEAPLPWPKETVVVQFDLARLLAGQDPYDWRYRARQCPALAHFNVPTAIGKSAHRPVLSLPCRAQPGSSDLQGVAVVELGRQTPTSTAGFVERFYPIAGDYSTAESYYDPVTDRLAMRRVGPAQLVVFDVAHRRWMRPIVFGQNNMYQSAFDPESGRIYGSGNDPAAGSDKEYVYVPEMRPVPPQNGLSVEQPSPSPQFPAPGVLAVDGRRQLVYIGDVDIARTSTGAVRDGLFFHVYRDSRPPYSSARVFDPDTDVINLSAESQGYGARVSYVGGVGGTFSNGFMTQYPPQLAGIVAQGTRHATFARTLRARLTEGEASAEAIVSHPEGATDAELTFTGEHTGEGWPHEATSCRDFGGSPARAQDESGDAEVTCDLDYPRATSAAVYQAETDDPRTAPIQRAATRTEISIHATKGVVTTVTSEGSLDIPGIVSIGQLRATATTFAAGKKGTAASTYSQEMKEVAIGGQSFCSSDCDPDEVAAAINERFAPTAAGGMLVVATVPRPDPALLASDGGVQAIVQRDMWDHEEDLGVHDKAEDRYELPAFVVTIYQDRRYPQHEVYSLAGVQAVSRLPRALADKLDELASPDPDLPTASIGAGPAGDTPSSPADFDAPVGPAGSSLSAPVRPSGGGARRGAGALRFSERLAWAVASPFRSPAMLAILAFLAVPVYLSSRRRVLLVHRPAEAGDVDAR